MAETVTVSATGDHLTIRFLDGAQHRFHAVWLRDNALDPASRAVCGGQRLITLTDVPVDIRIQTATTHNGAIEVSFAPEGNSLSFPSQWLKQNAYDYDKTGGFYLPEGVQTWDNARHAPPPESVCATRSNRAFARQNDLLALQRYGFLKLPDCNHITLPRANFQHDGNSIATQFSASPAPHTSETYRNDVSGLKVFYSAGNAPKHQDILLIDGFRVAERLRDNNPRGFDLLASYPARFEHHQANGKSLHARRPMINIAPDGQLAGLRFDNRYIAPIVDVPFGQLTAYYAAYRQFTALIHDADMALTVSLAAGAGLVLDNKRLLHVARPSSDANTSWLHAFYAETDGFFANPPALEYWVEAAE